jgi:AraC-like DNA-binding protein
MLQLGSEITVGRAAYTLNAPFRQPVEYSAGSVGFFVMLSGLVRYTTRRRSETFETSCVWVRDGRRFGGEMRYEVPAGKKQVAVSVDVPPGWLETQPGADVRTPVGTGLFTRLAGEGAQHCLGAAQSLLRLRPDSIVSRLRMESAALDLAAALLDFPASQGPLLPRRHRAAVDDAVAILRGELEGDHTIASLARRVGLNECSLKAAFRQVTGTTIAAYLRDQRMHHARTLIEHEGLNVQLAAVAVGYSNPSHFAAAFRKAHGRAPSSLR